VILVTVELSPAVRLGTPLQLRGLHCPAP
jgi:hypothetical protein